MLRIKCMITNSVGHGIIIYCSRCGGYTHGACVKSLGVQCESKFGVQSPALRRIIKLQHPVTKDPLLAPWRLDDVWTDIMRRNREMQIADDQALAVDKIEA